MLQACIAALVVFCLTATVLMIVEIAIHRIFHNPYKSYRWGVWLLASLLAIYTFVVNLGT